MSNEAFDTLPPGGPAPRRDLSGVWDAGAAGIGGQGQAAARDAARAPFTPPRPGHVQAKPARQRRQRRIGCRQQRPAVDGRRSVRVSADPELRASHRADRSHSEPGADALRLQQDLARDLDRRPRSCRRIRIRGGSGTPSDAGSTTPRSSSTATDWTIGRGSTTTAVPHSTALRVQERYRRVNQNTLELTVTIDDPMVYTKPWISRDRLPLKRLPDNTDVLEMIYSASEAQAYKETISSQTRP